MTDERLDIGAQPGAAAGVVAGDDQHHRAWISLHRRPPGRGASIRQGVRGFSPVPGVTECGPIRALRPASRQATNPGSTMAYKKYMCIVCGWIYDEELGAPDEGIPPGTRWEDVPLNWTCPECGAGKQDFDLVEL